ncbi:CLUMA_CG001579, isoform A [Clunio marinus]|uniref:CLUMA_CG001579, isoform A n=1 Tax=Clunio marinus TaxID=568069 RepID=A0A1J1HIC0_9DIPT|nr:CLUMA_CG001579, isoform A [Clunio marinus]
MLTHTSQVSRFSIEISFDLSTKLGKCYNVSHQYESMNETLCLEILCLKIIMDFPQGSEAEAVAEAEA